MTDFNETELLVARNMITAGLKKAAESLSFFMKETISFKEPDYYRNWGDSGWELEPKKEPNIHLLVTEIVGDLKGICCLIFTEEEANQLRRTALPLEITSNPALMAEMSDAIMLEVDNIITASVITQFANTLQQKMHGGVPQLHKLNFPQLNNFVSSEKNKDRYSINFKTHFATAKGNFNPEFLFLFDGSFAECIKGFATAKSNTLNLQEWAEFLNKA